MQTLSLDYWPPLYAFLLSVGLIALLIKPARALGWVDLPSARKHHRQPVPLVGGAAMCIAYCLSMLSLPEKPDSYQILLTSMVMLTLVGIYDDLRPTRPTIRFLFQIGAALLMIIEGGISLASLGHIFGLDELMLGIFAIPCTVFCVVGVINAFNMIDGLDGLAGGLGLIAAGWLVALSLTDSDAYPGAVSGLLLLIMVIAGFLVYNLRHPWRARASVFMGDAGSTMLGFAFCWFMVHLSQDPRAVMTPITAVWILAVPLMDTVTLMVSRMRAGQSPFCPDRRHLHHLLLSYGFSDGQVTAILLGTAFTSGAVGAGAYWLGIPEHQQFYAFMTLFLLYYGITTRIWRKRANAAAAVDPDRRQPPISKSDGSANLLQAVPQQNEP